MALRWVKWLAWLPAVPVAVALLYATTAWVAIQHKVGWKGKFKSVDEFRFQYNGYEQMVADGSRVSAWHKRRFDVDQYLWVSTWVRHGQISQCITFSLWPFRVIGWPGYVHPPGT